MTNFEKLKEAANNKAKNSNRKAAVKRATAEAMLLRSIEVHESTVQALLSKDPGAMLVACGKSRSFIQDFKAWERR